MWDDGIAPSIRGVHLHTKRVQYARFSGPPPPTCTSGFVARHLMTIEQRLMKSYMHVLAAVAS